MGKKIYAKMECDYCSKELEMYDRFKIGQEKVMEDAAVKEYGWKKITEEKVKRIYCPECYAMAVARKDMFPKLVDKMQKKFGFEIEKVISTLTEQKAYFVSYAITIWRGNSGIGGGIYMHKEKAEEVKSIIESDHVDICGRQDLSVVIEKGHVLLFDMQVFLTPMNREEAIEVGFVFDENNKSVKV